MSDFFPGAGVCSGALYTEARGKEYFHPPTRAFVCPLQHRSKQPAFVSDMNTTIRQRKIQIISFLLMSRYSVNKAIPDESLSRNSLRSIITPLTRPR
ncbi:hypothetical protein AVEN_271328-1 [Araneus ventricosus]|uniref:Uncharacterized protein n=1 Tax=Araneus ventricosus TaxID=182803 RepID=A0A4Y2WWD7_ARAVE|nr:hypothetical protein AVEN_271328-1 [Araneus ventricosus]